MPLDSTANSASGAQLTPHGFPDPDAIRRLGAPFCARHGILPLRPAGALRPVLCEDPGSFAAISDRVSEVLGPVRPFPALREDIATQLIRFAGDPLAKSAEQRSPPDRSCRDLSPRVARIVIVLSLAALAAVAAPKAVFLVGNLLAMLCLMIHTAMHVVALIPSRVPTSDPPPLPDAELPVISILVPLFQEQDIATILMGRLAALDYPRDRLDLCLIVEHTDRITAATLAQTSLPGWVRVLSVAPGTVQTKPRAMNMALDFCRGSIVGIYDAEDAPDPRQLRKVADYFAQADPQVVALQGRLNFYNTRATWLTRCFSIDYAAWFWVTLPVVQKLGWPVLLGGTTVFLRREALEAVGGWDAHNVTEDADLGIRLARAGYRTDLIDTVTFEEATANPKAWIRQRSRWQKGYAVTWVAHMRHPISLLCDLGPWRFFGVQVLLLASLVSTALAPFLWPIWLLLVNVHHPVAGLVHPWAFLAISLFLGSTLIIHLIVLVVGVVRQDRPALLPWIPVMQLYYPLATISLVKAVVEFVICPFF